MPCDAPRVAISSHVVRETELLKANDAVRGRTDATAVDGGIPARPQGCRHDFVVPRLHGDRARRSRRHERSGVTSAYVKVTGQSPPAGTMVPQTQKVVLTVVRDYNQP